MVKLYNYSMDLKSYTLLHRVISSNAYMFCTDDVSQNFITGEIQNFLLAEGQSELLGRKLMYDVESELLSSSVDLSKLISYCYKCSSTFQGVSEYDNLGYYYYYCASPAHWEEVIRFISYNDTVDVDRVHGESVIYRTGINDSKYVCGMLLPDNKKIAKVDRRLAIMLDIRLGERGSFYLLGL